MDNAGDWLYIVFLAIAGISSLFSSKNKKKRPKQILGQPDKEIVTSEKEVPAKGFWEILEEMQKPEPVKQPAAVSRRRENGRQAVFCQESPCHPSGRRGKPAYGDRVRQCRRTAKSGYLH